SSDLDSTLREGWERGGIVAGGQVLLVGSHVVNTAVADAAVRAESVFAFNSNFSRLTGGPAGGNYPEATAIEATDVQVSFTTFYNNTCTYPWGCYADVVSDVYAMDNSLFVHPMPEYSEGQPEIEPAFYSIVGDLPPSNCSAYISDDFLVENVSTVEVLTSNHPCRDGGDALAAEASRQQLLALTSPFLADPFRVELGRYAAADWWQKETILTDACSDEAAPDPGQHLLPKVCQAECTDSTECELAGGEDGGLSTAPDAADGGVDAGASERQPWVEPVLGCNPGQWPEAARIEYLPGNEDSAGTTLAISEAFNVSADGEVV